MDDITRIRIRLYRLSYQWQFRGKILKIRGKILQFLVNRDREKEYRYRQRHEKLLERVSKYNDEMRTYPLEGFDVKKYERTLREEGREEYIREEKERQNKLVNILMEQNRMEDLKRSIYEADFRKQLYREFHL